MKHSNVALFIPNAGCPNQCSFCNQRTISGTQSAPSIERVRKELEQAFLTLAAPPEETEIAFFGGSFTMLEQHYMTGLLSVGREYVRRFGCRGIRVSTRPDAISPEILNILYEYDVTAVELGAQSMDDDVLKANRRGHTARQVCEASELIHGYGFELGLQMMVGLYGSTPEKDRETAEQLAGLFPKTVRIYPTVILRGTELEEKLRNGRYQPYPMEEAVSLCAGMLEFFAGRGIDVIRVGLHASRDIEQEMAGGIYHPAFRELCESRIYLDRALRLPFHGSGDKVTLQVKSSELSKMIGQRRKNIIYLEQEWKQRIKIAGEPSLAAYEIKVLE
ncbi:elongator complex protein 3 [Massiliimalia massiliensis]|uniref:elongator complex protein 3 n=1 Tax=Massiliimalia massiliensis TaxID=1852384 RepID=UPI00098641A9|nr:radical SAM protein [Massiliimalia massiliensis]